MVAFYTDPDHGAVVSGHGIEPGGTHRLSIASHSYDRLRGGVAERSSQWCDVTFPAPELAVGERFGQPVFRERDCVFRCPIDGSLQRLSDGSMRGSGGYVSPEARERWEADAPLREANAWYSRVQLEEIERA